MGHTGDGRRIGFALELCPGLLGGFHFPMEPRRLV